MAFVVDPKKPLKSVKEVSYFLFAMIKNLPAEEQHKLTLQQMNYKDRRALLWKLHLLNCAIDRIEKGILPTEEDEKTNRVKQCAPRMKRRVESGRH